MHFDNTYARLPDRFFARVSATHVSNPKLVMLNRSLAERLGVSDWDAEIFSGNVVPDGAEPIALAYAGHQFGSFVPQLGDGRAILLGEIVDTDGRRRDIQLKGSGRTPFSRGGDGRAALGPVLREYVVSEAMAALGIPTTRALAAVTTGDRVHREGALPGAVLTRVAASHVRVGTFQFFAARRDVEALRALTAHALSRHYPDAAGTKNPAVALLENTIDAHADLVAKWLGVGFVHGVMNTDNTAISGETLDYGPCAFLDEYDPNKTFSSIDRGARYAYSNQPSIALWNMARLGESLLPLVSDDRTEAVRVVTETLERFGSRFDRAYIDVMRAKIGLVREEDDDESLLQDALTLLAKKEGDFTVFFRTLATNPLALGEEFHGWRETWRARVAREDGTFADAQARMRRVNPAFIPRNHRIEEMITDAIDEDFTLFETMVRVLAKPFDDQDDAQLATPPLPAERVSQTFCGT
jgi:uncharacterized protein YdiU (UPF0061 family)